VETSGLASWKIERNCLVLGLWIGDGTSIESSNIVTTDGLSEVKRIQVIRQLIGLNASDIRQSPSQIETKSGRVYMFSEPR